MKIQFDKMQGLGNDFVVINATSQPFTPTVSVILQLADRRYGIGFDQLLIIKKPRSDQADFYFQIFNADGSEAIQCGNGARCVAKYIIERQLSNKKCLKLETQSRIVSATIDDKNHVTVDMGKPTYQLYPLANYSAVFVDMGNPHIIIFLEELENSNCLALRNEISKKPEFSSGVNVGFAKKINKNFIQLSTFERGTGITLACGSNACAAVVAGNVLTKLAHRVNVSMKGGSLDIVWQGAITDSVFMKGPAVNVFSGEISVG